MFKDYYAILQVSHNASKQEIKKAYRIQAKKWHPDKNSAPEATDRMQNVIEAFLILSDDNSRNLYNVEYSKYKSESCLRKQEPTYNIKDKDLFYKMSDAAKEAKEYVNGTFNDILAISSFAFKEAIKYVVKFVVISFGILFILSIIIGVAFEIADQRMEVTSLDSLPNFKETEEFTSHKIPYFGTFQMPPTMERKVESENEVYNDLQLMMISRNRESVIYKATFQQKGLNILESQAKEKYARILVSTEIIQPNYFPFNFQKPIIKQSDFKHFVEGFKKQINQHFEMMDGSLFDWIIADFVSINNRNALHFSYRRRRNDNPVVYVDNYFFLSNDTLRSITLSYRENDSLLFKEDFKKVIASLNLTANNINTPSKDESFAHVEVIDSLPVFKKNDNNVSKFIIDEFGSIVLPISMDSIFVSGQDQFITIFFDKKNSNKIIVMTNIGINVRANLNSSQITTSELKELEHNLILGYKLFASNIFKEEENFAVKINGLEAFRFCFTMKINDNLIKNVTYMIEDYDRMHSIGFSCPVNEWEEWEETFLKVLESVTIPSVYTNNQLNNSSNGI